MMNFVNNKLNNSYLVAMSGGVDSSVAAKLMMEKSDKVAGLTLIMFDNNENACEKAKLTCDKLGIEHFTKDVSKRFNKEVIEPFIDGYVNGLTPNPCVICNPNLKFYSIIEDAPKLGYAKIVTGHYAKIKYDENKKRWLLLKGADPKKDQSYMLYGLSQEQLSKIEFPLGELTKDKVRELAETYGFVNAKDKDSQDICFLPNGGYSDFIREKIGETKVSVPGDYITKDGKIIGKHKGVINYTIGQRKHLGIPLDPQLYVLSKNPKDNTITLGLEEDLFSDTCYVNNINWIAIEDLKDGEVLKTTAKPRYSKNDSPCTVYNNGGKIKVVFDEKQRALSPGQAIVFYDEDIVVGGGIISLE